MRRPTPIPPGPGQESVWDYPRPPALEKVDAELRIEHAGRTIARTTRGYRVLETSHPPVYYFPPEDVDDGVLEPAEGRSFCEWKGLAEYVTVRVGDDVFERVGWTYPDPTPAFEPLAGHIAFYARPFDGCYVGEEKVTPQPGEFYGGWITSNVVGPFKGIPGSAGW